MFLLLSFIVNVIFSVFLFVVGNIYSSNWFFAVSIYYALLSMTRIFIFFQTSPKKPIETRIKNMRTCGYFVLLISLVFSAMMFVLIYGNQHVKHHEITVITLATYTFTSLTFSIINVIKYFRKANYIYSSATIISLISTSISIVTLTNTMLFTFGETNVMLRSITLPILSGIVSVFINTCAILMIRKTSIDLRKLRNEKERK